MARARGKRRRKNPAPWRRPNGNVDAWRKSGLEFWSVPWNDGDTETVEGVKYKFNEAAARHVCQFFEQYLRHFEGDHAGKLFKLEHWQRLLLRTLFGWKRPDGLRRFRTCFLFVPRKNGKSTLEAGIGLYLTLADGEEGAQVYSAAADREQARIVFDTAGAMIEQEPRLQARTKVYKRSITVPETRSRYVVVSSDAKKKHGYNSHGVIVDELHAHENRDLYDVLNSSMIARKQPLLVIATTAGYDRHHICFEHYTYAKRILAGDAVDPRYLAVIFEAGEKDDWHDPKVWRKANPNFGVTIQPAELEAEHRMACQMPGYENTFKRLYLNIWTEQAARWLPMDLWRELAGPTRNDDTWEEMRGREGYIGVDLSAVQDITAAVLVVPDEKKQSVDVFCKCWVPQESAIERARRDKVPYIEWARKGFLTFTEGRRTDQTAIRLGIHEWAKHVRVMEIAADRWEAERLLAELEDDGFDAFAHGQGWGSMSGPSKELERMVLGRQIRHGGHPVLEWCARNVATMTDPAGNIKPAKDKSADRIDLIVCLVMALGRAMLPRGNTSVYDRRGRGLQGI